MVVATSYGSLYQDCRGNAMKQNIEVPHYTLFLLQFCPCSRTASSLLHYTGRFKVRLMVQARIFQKHNPDCHYCNVIYNFIKQRAWKYSVNSTFFCADAKYKTSVGEPDFPFTCVARGKKVVVGLNGSFQVADHDFSKISIIPDAVFIQQIPEENYNEGDEFNIDTNSWFFGQVYYGFKNMVTQGSSAIRGVVEMGKIIETEKINATRFYAITDGGGDRRVDFLSIQKSLADLFLYHDFDKILICRTAAGLSYCNHVERVHAIANLGLQSVGIMRQRMPLQSVGIMRQRMPPDMEN